MWDIKTIVDRRDGYFLEGETRRESGEGKREFAGPLRQAQYQGQFLLQALPMFGV
jgi:hypothetical protein